MNDIGAVGQQPTNGSTSPSPLTAQSNAATSTATNASSSSSSNTNAKNTPIARPTSPTTNTSSPAVPVSFACLCVHLTDDNEMDDSERELRWVRHWHHHLHWHHRQVSLANLSLPRWRISVPLPRIPLIWLYPLTFLLIEELMMICDF